MRLLVYNIRYAVGAGPSQRMPVPGASYLFGNPGNLDNITNFIKSVDPDVVGLIEVDIGSMRTGRVNQAEAIGKCLPVADQDERFFCHNFLYSGTCAMGGRSPI